MRRLLPLALLATAACDGGDPPADDPVDTPQVETFARIQADILVPKCGASCHGTEARQGGLNVEGPEAYDELFDADCDNEQARVEGLVRVAPGNPEHSFLWIKVTDATGFGDPMPPFGALDDDELERIANWIAQGAPR